MHHFPEAGRIVAEERERRTRRQADERQQLADRQVRQKYRFPKLGKGEEGWWEVNPWFYDFFLFIVFVFNETIRGDNHKFPQN